MSERGEGEGARDDVAFEPGACPVCGEERVALCGIEGCGFRMARCPACTALFQQSDPSLKPEPYAELYGGNPGMRIEEALAAHPKWPYDVVLDDLAAEGMTSGRLLDVGCSYGYFVAYARMKGWDSEGIDLSPQATGWARSQGLPCAHVALEAYRPDRLFDAIAMENVLEHVSDPGACLRQALELLRPGGLLHLKVPNVESAVIRRSRRNLIGQLKPFEHLIYFSPRSVDVLCERLGHPWRQHLCERHLLVQVLDYKVRSAMVLRQRWVQMRYAAGSPQAEGTTRAARVYHGAKRILGSLRWGPADVQIAAVIRKRQQAGPDRGSPVPGA